jgi:hypothetical protein
MVTSDLVLHLEHTRKNVPVFHFYCELYHGSQTDKSYFELKNGLIKEIGACTL